MHIVERKPTDLTPYPGNPRLNDAGVDAVARSIQAFGFRQPIVVDENGVIVVGHTRHKAALKLGLELVPVHVAIGLTEAQLKAYRIADNQTATLSEWDDDKLAMELLELSNLDYDLDLTGFSADEIASYIESPAEGLTDPDDIPEPPVDPITQPGDLWLLGHHRLLCGDSTSAADVARLLGDRRPFLMVTDPPYGVEYDPEWRKEAGVSESARTGKVVNDHLVDWSAAYKLFPGDVAYVWHASTFTIDVGQHLRQSQFQIRSSIIWRKPSLVLSRGHYHWQHEPCWYAVREGKTAKWAGDRSQSTMWDIARKDGTGETVHGTQKPVECMARPIRNHGGKDDDVFDPFLGSGTTIIACEQLGRRCCGLEISPAYVDVIVQRWEQFTGKKAERQIA
ncbi:MAG: ParB N-terminal domain-containing protein [Gemmataceae bacterium]|nr:ParB N-terminal domain-containing protein [Gemmataceae bacterium]